MGTRGTRPAEGWLVFLRPLRGLRAKPSFPNGSREKREGGEGSEGFSRSRGALVGAGGTPTRL